MAETAVRTVTDRYQDSEIVADSADAPLLVELAGELARLEAVATIDAFDITLLSVHDLTAPTGSEEWAAVAISWKATRAAQYGLPGLGMTERDDGLREPSDLEVLMGVLRRRFTDAHGRQPRMGKNRDMQVMEGRPHTGGGEGKPIVPEDAGSLAPRTSVVGRGCRVGVLDTAVFPVAPLRGRYLSDDGVNASEPWPKWVGHASFVIGRILRRAPGAEIDAREVLSEADGTAPAWRVAERMGSFLGSGVQILNMSLGGFTADGQAPFLMTRAVERLGAEMLVVASAGNHGKAAPTDAGAITTTSRLWPAALEDVVAVGAATLDGTSGALTPAPFTPPGVPWIDVMAPGVDVLSTYIEGIVAVDPDDEQKFSGWALWSGTSFAAGDVTGELASIVQRTGVSAREALAEVLARDPADGSYDIRPTG